jgi:hypothetical protein
MDSTKNEGSKNGWAKEIEAAQLEDTRKQPWKEAIAADNGVRKGEESSFKSPDLVDDGSEYLIMSPTG